MLIYQYKDGYCYNSDTHILYNFIKNILNKFKNKNLSLLDVGCGTGILGLLLKRDFGFDTTLIDIQKEYTTLAKENARVNNLNVKIQNIDFLDIKESFDIIVSNPPFYENVIESNNLKINIARYNKHLPLKKFLTKISTTLKPKGKAFFCYDINNFDNIIILLNQLKLNIENIEIVYPKKDKNAKIAMFFVRKDTKTPLKINKPFFIFENNNFSKEMEDIYKQSNTYSIKF